MFRSFCVCYNGSVARGRDGLLQPTLSVIIPTYNRRIILEKALRALARQTVAPEQYEVIVIDDGSTDDTETMVNGLDVPYRLTYRKQVRSGPATARNHGIRLSESELIVFIDSDIVVTKTFLAAHLAIHGTDEGTGEGAAEHGIIGHGPVIHTDNIDDPTAATMKITDISRAFFATGNVSIRREHLLAAGLFDEEFVEYGWEDLELGLRLRKLGLRAVQVAEAEGYHYKRPLQVADVPNWCQRERERGHTAVIYYRKAPTFRVRMQTLLTPVAFGLDRILSLGNWPDKPGTMKFLQWLEDRGWHGLLRFFARLVTHHAYMDGLREALAGDEWDRPDTGGV